MKVITRRLLVLILSAVLSGCSGSDGTSPIAPTPVVPSASVAPSSPRSGPGTGTIAIRELGPALGATLTVQSRCPAGSVTRVCTDQWRGTFDVTVDREMTNAVLTVRFYDRDTICGYAAGTVDIVPAGMPTSFTAQRIVLSDEFGTFKQPCRLPATTNRIEVELWSDLSTWTNTLIQVFEGGYTFQRP
jgi:hypothetical protein